MSHHGPTVAVTEWESDGVGHMGRDIRRVALRDGEDGRFLDAWVDGIGRLHLDGQDLGGDTEAVWPSDEYEWFSVIAADEVPAVRELLGIDADEDLLDVLERDWTGPERSRDLERRLRESDVQVRLQHVT
jgi:hypothetical protein